MRDSITGAWLLMIVLIFMVVFIAYISISINYSNVFKLKTNVVTTIEEYGGLNSTSIEKINGLLSSGNYNAKAGCTSESGKQTIGIKGDYVDRNVGSGKYNLCVYREHRSVSSNSNDKYYYTVELFLDFQLPVIGNLYDFRVSGETNAIYYPNDTYFTN